MKLEALKEANQLVKEIEKLKTELLNFNTNMGYGKNPPKTLRISSGDLIFEQTEITDNVLIEVIIIEVYSRLKDKIKKLTDKLNNL
jgi:hypothetical protein